MAKSETEQTRANRLRTPGKRQRLRVRVFRPLAIEIGWLAYEWNRLHEAMAELFADIVTLNVGVGFSIWYSTTNERVQRDMLRAAVEATYRPQNEKPKQHGDIMWLLNQLNELGGRRNNIIHSPFVFVNDLSVGEIEILPHYFFGNPRATELRDKSLLEEFKWCRDQLSRLAYFAEQLHYAMAFPDDFPWPARPQLPTRDHFKRQLARSRKK
jgi:hypothetical protein